MRANIRLCKGIYVEPRQLAYQDRELINRNYALVLERLLRSRLLRGGRDPRRAPGLGGPAS